MIRAQRIRPGELTFGEWTKETRCSTTTTCSLLLRYVTGFDSSKWYITVVNVDMRWSKAEVVDQEERV